MIAPDRSHWLAAQALTQQRNWSKAIPAYARITTQSPGFVPAWLELSLAHEQAGDYRDALRAALAASRIVNDVPPVMVAAVARRLRQFEEGPRAMHYIGQTAVVATADASSLCSLAIVAATGGEAGIAKDWADQAVRRFPDHAHAWFTLGSVRFFLGEFLPAQQALLRALALNPASAQTYRMLAQLGLTSPDNNRVGAIQGLLKAGGLKTRDEAMLCYALHDELHALGDYEQAWTALERGMQAKKAMHSYAPAATPALFEAIRTFFNPAFLKRNSEPTPQQPRPIFIVGMYRSGSTVLARMLSGHPSVGDVGESYLLTAQLRWAADHWCRPALDERLVAEAATYDYSAIGENLVSALAARCPGRTAVIEKTNANFMNLGFIAKAMPQAAILHTVREPIEACFSNLRTLFTNEAVYSYDQIQLADYYAAYRGLMQHWRDVLGDALVEVRLDDLTGRPRSTAERVAATCGLHFDPRMLALDRDGGQVVTASSAMARQTLRNDRAKIWEAYASHLAPLLDTLAYHGLA